MEEYADYQDWQAAVMSCRMVSVEVDGNGNAVMHDGIDTKSPCTSFDKAYGSANGAYICLLPEDRRPARSFWPCLKKAMKDDVRLESELIDKKIERLLEEVKELRAEKAGLKRELSRIAGLKLK